MFKINKRSDKFYIDTRNGKFCVNKSGSNLSGNSSGNFGGNGAPARTLYFTGGLDNEWNTLGNWWNDAEENSAATSLPTSADSVVLLTAEIVITSQASANSVALPNSLIEIYGQVQKGRTGGGEPSVNVSYASFSQWQLEVTLSGEPQLDDWFRILPGTTGRTYSESVPIYTPGYQRSIGAYDSSNSRLTVVYTCNDFLEIGGVECQAPDEGCTLAADGRYYACLYPSFQ